jgi:TM2 domain-containing membrane protein YozV
MRGQILGVDARTGDGLVAGDDGRRYTFRPDDWANRGEPAIGLKVDFDIEDTRARSIYPIPGAMPPVRQDAGPRAVRSDRNKLVAALLAFFIGTLGVHRFYLGRTGSGIVMLVLSITVIGLIATVPWAIIDMIRYLMMSDEEFADRYARRLR